MKGLDFDLVCVLDVVKKSTTKQFTLQCRDCGKTFKGHGTRMRAHTLGLKGKGVSACTSASENSRKICRDIEAGLAKKSDALKKRKDRISAMAQAKRLKRESSLSQSSMSESVDPDLAGKKILLDRAWARAAYANGMAFRMFDDTCFRRFVVH